MILEVEVNEARWIMDKADMNGGTIKSIKLRTKGGRVVKIETPERPVYI